MKKTIIFLLIVISAIIPYAQAQESVKDENTNKSLLAATYRLFPTQNMWTFIKLNTRNGKMWQVQFDVKGNNRFSTDLNFIPLITKEEEVNDRFTLYSTQNTYNFILLDQLDGRTWQVQWSVKPEQRGLWPIE